MLKRILFVGLCLFGIALFAEDATYQKGLDYLNGTNGCIKDSAMAFVCFEAASHTDTEAMRMLAHCYLRGIGTTRDPYRTLNIYRTLSTCGDYLYGNVAMSWLYWRGEGVERDERKAYEMCMSSVEKGFAPAYKVLGYFQLDRGSFYNPDSAFRWASLGFESGDTEAAILLAGCYLRGLGCAVDYNKGLKFLKVAADANYAQAYFVLGNCYEHGLGVRRDPARAFAFYKKAYQDGYYEAAADLGAAYLYGRGIRRNEEKGHQLLYQGILDNDPRAMMVLGDHLLYNVSYESEDQQDMSKVMEAEDYYKRAVACGYFSAMNSLGELYKRYYKSDGGAQKAIRLYQEHVDSTRDPIVAYWLALELDAVGRSAMAVPYFEMAAAAGNHYAHHRLFQYYYSGAPDPYEVKQDYKKAFEWVLKIASDCSYGAEMVGVCYEYGHGIKRDHEKAAEYYHRAAFEMPTDKHLWAQKDNLGMTIPFPYRCREGSYAAYKYGYLYSNSKLITHDKAKAFKGYEKATELGYKNGPGALGVYYLQGWSVPPDSKRAYDLFMRGVKNNDRYAMEFAGICYLEGHGVKPDSQKAFDMFSKAVELKSILCNKHVANFYENGYGVVNVDSLRAFQHYEVAWKGMKNNGETNYCMGRCYEMGIGVEIDPKRAVEFYTKAKKAGYKLPAHAEKFCKEYESRSKKDSPPSPAS